MSQKAVRNIRKECNEFCEKHGIFDQEKIARLHTLALKSYNALSAPAKPYWSLQQVVIQGL